MAGVNPTLHDTAHVRRLLRGILSDFLLTFEEQPLPRQPTVLLQFLQALILFVVIELDANFDHTVTHKPHFYVCSDTTSSR